jgi:Iap family predicted aminopeptidase
MMLGRLAAAVLLLALATACSDRDEPNQGAPATATIPTPTATATATPGRPSPPGTATDLAAYDNARAIEHIRVLSVDIGTRIAGSEDERLAVDYIREQLEASGYTVDVDEFSYAGNRFAISRVIAGETAFEGFALQGSGSGTASGTAVFIGLGDEDGIDGRSLEGAVAIADRGVIPFRIKYLNARDAGAVALVVINDEPRSLINGRLDAFASLPVVGVDQQTGDALRLAAESGLDLEVTANTGDAGQALNVLARADATVPCLLLVGGHHDTVPSAPGANDNASGVAHVLELARAAAADGLDPGLCFATFGAEESGLYGSKEMVRQLQGQDGLPPTMINLDVTGTGPDAEAIGTPSLVATAIEVARRLQVPARATILPPQSGSDHTSFEQAGAEVILLSSGDYSMIHTPRDTFDAIEPDELERVGKLAHAVMVALYEEVAPG